jgi:hypothetical protein
MLVSSLSLLRYFEFRVMTFEATVMLVFPLPRLDKARLRGGPFGQLPRVPSYKGHEDDTGITRNMVPVNIGYHFFSLLHCACCFNYYSIFQLIHTIYTL